MSKHSGLMKMMTLLIAAAGLSMLLSACHGGGSGGNTLPPTYTLSGTVSGDIAQGVTISVSGAVNATVTTDGSGNYSVSGLRNGSYTVTPSRAGYTFSQASTNVVISGADSTGNDFASTAVFYAVTGSVTGAAGTGVTITVSGTTEGGSPFSTFVSTSSGSYSVPNVPNGSYTVTPTKTGYTFSPVSRAVAVSAANAAVAVFDSTINAAVTFNLTGTVTGAVKAGVTITVTGSASGSATTAADGTYTVPNLPNGSYTVSAAKPGYTFSSDVAATISGADSGGNDFTATAVLYSISGIVVGDVKSGVTVTVGGTTEGGAVFGPLVTTTSTTGGYTAAGIPNGTYTVAASREGYAFNPLSYVVTITAANAANRDFTASMDATAFIASGGTGSSGWGGSGGQFTVESAGSIQVLKNGTLDASFTMPTATPDLGANPVVVAADTTVSDIDDTPGALCQVYNGDGSLYIGDGTGTCGDGGDTQVTGLAIDAGVTLTLIEDGSGAGTLILPNDLVVNGTITTDLSAAWGLYIEANLIDVESGGMISASATTPDSDGGEIDLGYGTGMTKTIINRGIIEARGDGTGTGGYIYCEPDELVVNTGTIDVSGGNNGGSGGEFDAVVDYGDFYSSGTVRMNGGNGDMGGETEYSNNWWYGYSAWIETAYRGNANGRNGDIVISGTWEAKGGDGANGNGGSGGYLYFQTDGIGTVTLNATMSVKGGSGAGSGSLGGYGGEIDVYSALDPNGNGGYNDPTPGTIGIAGAYDLRGGNGDQDGGGGGYFAVYAWAVNSLNVGSDVQCPGFPAMAMNGGQGGADGGSALSYSFHLYTYSPDGLIPSGPITNEADIQAKGGTATAAGGTGGMGGYVEILADTPSDPSTVVSNSGNIDVSGGDGDSGGSAYDGGDSVYLAAYHVGGSGSITANGGNGTTSGGSGGTIDLYSDDLATNYAGPLSVAGGAPDYLDGAIYVDGNQTYP